MKTRHVFSTRDTVQAAAAVAALRAHGLGDEAISLVARSDIELDEIPDRLKDASTDFIPAAVRGMGGDPRGGGKHFGETRHRKRRHRRMLAQAMNGSACDAASGAD